LMVDPDRFPSTFSGYGLIPAIRSIELEHPLAVGTTRRIQNADGSRLSEQVTALDRPAHQAYTLRGFRAPFSWLVSHADADWSITPATTGSLVRWRYTFTLSSVWAYPLAACVLHLFMARAMQRCLQNMDRVLAADAPQKTASAKEHA